MKYKCLTIAGFDGSGGAGIQADLKTFTALGCYGMTVLTAIPIQNTQGVSNCYNISIKCIDEQLESIFSDIKPDCIKIGMVYNDEIIKVIYKYLNKYKNIPVICDPVMLSKNGSLLLKDSAIESLKKLIFPLSALITPNLPEAYSLIGDKYNNKKTAVELLKFGSYAVLLKGGHSLDKNKCEDFLLTKDGEQKIFSSIRIDSKNTHGTGCTLSAAICAYMARGYNLANACEKAKLYLLDAIEHSRHYVIGNGNGPLNHLYKICDSNL